MSDLRDKLKENGEFPLEINFTYQSFSKVPGGRKALEKYEPDLEEDIKDMFLEQENSECILEWFGLNSYRLNIDVEYVEREDRYTLHGYLKPSNGKLLDIYFRKKDDRLEILGRRIKKKTLPSYLRSPIQDEDFQEVQI